MGFPFEEVDSIGTTVHWGLHEITGSLLIEQEMLWLIPVAADSPYRFILIFSICFIPALGTYINSLSIL